MAFSRFFSCIFFLYFYFGANAQIAIKSSSLRGLTQQSFFTSEYGQLLLSKPTHKTGMYKAYLLGGAFETIRWDKYTFEKEKVIVSFNTNLNRSDTSFCNSVSIFGANSPYMSEDGIRVGDTIELQIICKNIDELKRMASKTGKINYWQHNNTLYKFNSLSIDKIHPQAIIKISRIVVYP